MSKINNTNIPEITGIVKQGEKMGKGLNERIMYITEGNNAMSLCIRVEGYPTAEYLHCSPEEAVTKYCEDNALAGKHINVIDLRRGERINTRIKRTEL